MMNLKKRLATFPSPAGMSLTKLSLDGNVANLFFTVYRKLALHIICLTIVGEECRIPDWLEYNTQTVWKNMLYTVKLQCTIDRLKGYINTTYFGELYASIRIGLSTLSVR